jgi:putative oxidoreductase
MLVAILGVHWGSGFFLKDGGFEFALALFGMAAALMIHGGGAASVDAQMQGGKR